MNERLASLVAAPEDDALRLVWADARLEAGDLHGELVTTQCELARLGLEPPRLFRECGNAIGPKGKAALATLSARVHG